MLDKVIADAEAEALEKAKEKGDLEEIGADGDSPKIKLTLAEKIKKTALNTGIRFNIVDNMGFDNASLQMFQEAQKQGLNADELEFSDIVFN